MLTPFFTLTSAGIAAAGGAVVASSNTFTAVNTFSPAARSSGATPYLTVNAAADTALTAGADAIGVSFVGATRQHATGAVTLQRDVVFAANTHSAVAASTFSVVVNTEVASSIAGTNATFTKSIGLRCVASSATHVPGVDQGATSQTGNLREWQNSSGTVLAAVLPDGEIKSLSGSNYVSLSYIRFASPYITSSTTLSFSVNGGSTTNASLSTTLFQIQSGIVFGWNNGEIGFARVDANTIKTFGASSTSTPGALICGSPTSSTIGLTVKGAASRTAQIQQFQTSAGASLGNVSGGCTGDIIADVSTTHTDGTFDTLLTHTFVANAFIVNGDKFYFDFTLTTVSSVTASRDFKLSFGGITFFDSTALVFGSGVGTVRIFGYGIRKSSTTFRTTTDYAPSGSATILGQAVTSYTSDATLTGLTLTGTNNLVLSAAASGTGALSGDITLTMGTVGIVGFGS